jgi:YVTN family beta-propeller protein
MCRKLEYAFQSLLLFLMIALIVPGIIAATPLAVFSISINDNFPTAGSPIGIASGPDGNIWFTEWTNNKVIQMSAASGAITNSFSVPTPDSYPYGITAGPDGNLWFTESGAGKVGRITTTGVITEFATPAANSRPYDIAAGPDGNLWFTENTAGNIGRITTAGVITEFPVPTANSNPYGITAGPDGNMWFTEAAAGKIGQITTGGAITEFTIPAVGSNPYFIAAGSQDGALWFTEAGGNKIGRITIAGAISEFTVPSSYCNPFGITAGPDGYYWFAEEAVSNGGKIGQITTAGNITEFPTPISGSSPWSIATGPDQNVWFTETGPAVNSNIGQVSLISKPLAYVPNYGDDTLSVIDTGSNTIKATIPVGTNPGGAAVSPAGNYVYVTNYGSNNVSVIDMSTNGVASTIAVGSNPVGVALNPVGSVAYVANYNGNSVSVINTSTNSVVATVPTGTNPAGAAINPAGTYVYVANYGSNSVSVIDTGTNSAVATIPVGSNPNGIAVSPGGNSVYVANYGSNSVSVIDAGSDTVSATVSVGSNPYQVLVNNTSGGQGSQLFVTNASSNNISVVDINTNSVVATVNVGTSPYGVAANPAGTLVYVVNNGSNNISVIDTASDSVVATINVGSLPSGLGPFLGAPSAGAPGTYVIFSSANANGSITPNGMATVNPGDSQTYTILPGNQYQISDVLVDGGSVGPVSSYTFSNVASNHTIYALFAALAGFTITAGSDANGSVTPTGVTTVNAGGSQTYMIWPATGYSIADVQVDGVSQGAISTYTFSNVAADHTIYASFAALPGFTITASSDTNGSVTPTGVTTVNYGGSQTYTITPNAGYSISDVQVDGVSQGAIGSYTFSNVLSNHTISATFVVSSYTISASSDPNGAVTPAGDTAVNSGGSQSYTIAPNAGYYISDVQVDGASVGTVSSYTFSNVTANHTISATFALSTYAVTPTVSGPGTISPSTAQTVDYNATAAFTVTPNSGNSIQSVTGCGGTLAGDVFTTGPITGSCTVTATFM